MRCVAVALLCTQVACAGSQYQPSMRGTAKVVYDGRAKRVVVGGRSEQVNPFNAGYVDLFEGQAREYAADSRTDSLIGLTLGVVGLAAGIASFFILPDASDIVDLDSTRGQIAFGVLLGSVVVSSLGGRFQALADAELNDAINLHNDRFLDAAGTAPALYPRLPDPATAPAPPDVGDVGDAGDGEAHEGVDGDVGAPGAAPPVSPSPDTTPPLSAPVAPVAPVAPAAPGDTP